MSAVKNIKNTILFLLLWCVSAKAIPPSPPDFMTKRYGFSFAGGGIISFFKVDTRHSETAHMRPGMSGMVRMEIYASSNVHIQLGMEFMSQACRFNTYYFEQGYSTFYDRSFGYNHTLRTVEMYFPIMARIGTTNMESNSRNIFYFLGGYAPKFFLTTNTKIQEISTGNDIWAGATELDYEHQFLGAQTGNCMIVGMGLDHRIGFQEKFFSYELIYRYNLSRFIYHGRIGIDNSNELFLKNSCINIQIGYRFQ